MPPWFRFIERLGSKVQHPGQLRSGHLLTLLTRYLELGAVGLALLLALVAASWLTTVVLRRRAATRSVRLRILLPEQLEREGLVGFFRTLSAFLRPRLGMPSSVAFTISATGNQLEAELSCIGVFAPQVVAALRAAIQGVGVEPLPRLNSQDATPLRWARCSLRPTGSVWLPLEAQHRLDPAAQVLAALQSHAAGEVSAVQLVFSPLPSRASRRARKEAWLLHGGRPSGIGSSLAAAGQTTMNELLDLVTPGPMTPSQPAAAPVIRPRKWDVDRANAIEKKAIEPALALTIRLQTGASNRRWARERLSGLSASFTQFHALAGLRPGRELALARQFRLRMPARRPPLVVTAAEAAALLPLPEQAAESPLALPEAPARSVMPVASAPTAGVLIGLGEQEWLDG